MATSRSRGCQRQGVRHGPRPACRRDGVTLLELIVVMAMLGLVLAVAAPAFIVRPERTGTDLERVLGAARRTAVLRGEPVTLSVDNAGAWALTGDASPTAPAIATGTLEAPPGRMRVRVSPLGTCVPDLVPATSSQNWSAAGCGPVAAGVPRS
jgi:prepilin-type N-terminal cleavage/methylation domain-containing protein